MSLISIIIGESWGFKILEEMALRHKLESVTIRNVLGDKEEAD